MKLLIIEDELSLSEIMSVTLRKEGYVIENGFSVANSGEAELDKEKVFRRFYQPRTCTCLLRMYEQRLADLI